MASADKRSSQQDGRQDPPESHSGDPDPTSLTQSGQDNQSGPGPSSSVHVTETNTQQEPVMGSEERSLTLQELTVLSPQDPRIKKFMVLLNKHLTQELEKLNGELIELRAEEEAEKKDLEAWSWMVYTAKQELDKENEELEAQRQERQQAGALRVEKEEERVQMKGEHDKLWDQVTKKRRQVAELQTEEDKLNLKVQYLEELVYSRHHDVTAMTNKKKKTQAEKQHAAEEKRQQDMYVERLVKQEERMKEQISMYDVQTKAEAEMTKAVKENYAETQMALDSLTMDFKHVVRESNNSLLALQKRDQKFAIMQDSLMQTYQQLLFQEKEKENLTRMIAQQQEEKESMMIQLNQSKLKCIAFNKKIEQLHAQQEELEAQHSMYTKILMNTESNIRKANMEYAECQYQVAGLNKQLECEESRRLKLDMKLMHKLQERLIYDNSKKHIQHKITEITEQIKEKEVQVIKLENEVAALELKITEKDLQLEALARQQEELIQEIDQNQQLLFASEAMKTKMDIVIKRNQNILREYERKKEKLIAQTGHEDLAPMEIQKIAVLKKLEELEAEIKEQHQIFLKEQEELVKACKEREMQTTEVQELRNEFLLLDQNQLRKESELNLLKQELAEIEKQNKALMQERQRLKNLLKEQKDKSLIVQQNNILTEKSLISEIKEAERKYVEMKISLENYEKEKEMKLNTILEAEHQIMLWERKIKLAQEMKASIEAKKEDITSLQIEIHHLRRRVAELKKQEEKWSREMETIINKRDNIVMRHEAKACRSTKHPTSSKLELSLQALRREILQKHKEAEKCDAMIAQLQEESNDMSKRQKETELQMEELKNSNATNSTELSNLEDTREVNQAQLLALQGQVKELQAIKEGRFKGPSIDEAVVEAATQKNLKHLQTVRDVLQSVVDQHPSIQREFLKIITLIQFALKNHSLEMA